MADETKIAEMINISENYHENVPEKPDGNLLTIPLMCDGFSVDKVNDAKNARINAEHPKDRLEGLLPCAQEWHKRLAFLEVNYKQRITLHSGSYFWPYSD